MKGFGDKHRVDFIMSHRKVEKEEVQEKNREQHETLDCMAFMLIT